MSDQQYWDNHTFWATPIVYDAMDEFYLDELVRVHFTDYMGVPGGVYCVGGATIEKGVGYVLLNKWAWLRMTVEERRETLLHEAAHLITAFTEGKGELLCCAEAVRKAGHCWHWQEAMRRLRVPPSRYFVPNLYERSPVV